MGLQKWLQNKLRIVLLFFMSTLFVFSMENVQAMQGEVAYRMTSSDLQEKFYKSWIDKKISVDFNGETIKDALRQIANKTGLKLTYRGDVIQNKAITLIDNSIEVSDALNRVLEGTGLDYMFSEDGYLLVYKSRVEIRKIEIQETVSGSIVDAATGELLPGANILVKGTSTGGTTNLNGEFELTVPSLTDTLVFSYVGYQTIEEPLNGRTSLNVQLQMDEMLAEELVVVGYGVQQKENLTGSVSVIRGEEISNAPFTQASQALAGKVPGVTIQQNTGQPGRDQSTIRIRGLGTFSGAGNTPLVLVDGIASSINDVNPNDIESISVLKDASSAAIYGARAANGVIIIETKRGQEGGIEIEYNSYVGVQQPTSFPQYVDSWIFAEMENEAATNVGRSPVWTEEEIALFRSGEDPDNYPNENHHENLFNAGGSGLQTDQNLRFSGGTSSNAYNLSLGYLHQDGLIPKTSYERYNLRFKFNSKMSEKLNLRFLISGNRSNEGEPLSPGGELQNSAEEIIHHAIKVPNIIAGKKSDGTYGHSLGFTIPGWLDSNSFRTIENTNLRSDVGLDYNLSEALSFHGLVGYKQETIDNLAYKGTLQVNETLFQGPAELINVVAKNNFLTLQAYSNYILSLQDHNFTFLGGYSYEHNQDNSIMASRDNFPTDGLYQLNAGSSANMRNSGSGSEWAIQSLFGRINYSLKDRYLFEINARYDGSSRFPAESRYALFPSVSAGWILSDESFFTVDGIDFLKLRGSWGSLGNQNIGNYPYQQMLNLNVNSYPLGRGSESINPAAASTTATNPDITWETTTTKNIGMEMSVFDGKLDFEADYYMKNTKDILYNISSSYILGLTPSEVNAGAVENIGWDFRLQHRNNIGDFSYGISTNISIVKNQVTELAGLEKDIGRGLFVGYPLQSAYGYKVDGLFIDQDDIDNYPTQPYSASPGTYRFMDLDGDGIVTAENDRTIIGDEFPKYSYGATVDAQYKNVDISMQLTGQAGADRMLTSLKGRGLWRQSNIQTWVYENRWTPENPDRNAIYPRMENIAGGVHMWPSSYWYRSADYLKIENVRVGYSLPSQILNSIGVKNLYVYANGRNLFTFSDFYEGWDTEMSYYPPNRIISAGINITF